MKFMIYLATAFASLAIFSTAHARVVGTFNALVSSPQNLVREWSDLGIEKMGWKCSGTERIESSRYRKDHKGRPNVAQAHIGFSVFLVNAPVETQFTAALDEEDNTRYRFWVTENCEKEEISDDGKEIKIVTASMHWACDMSRLPTTERALIQTTCAPNNFEYSGFKAQNALMRLFEQKTLNLQLQLSNVQEHFDYNLCTEGQNQENRIVIALNQGVGGHLGEDDFITHVKIDGILAADIRTRDGILDHEIAYCGAKDTVRVEVSATEEDYFDDDQYKTNKAADFIRLSSRPKQKEYLTLKRQTFFNSFFTDEESEVVVTLREEPKKPIVWR